MGILEKLGSHSSLKGAIGQFVDILNEKVSNFEFAKRSKGRALVRSSIAASLGEQVEESVLTTKQHLIKLHARLMTAQLKARASERRWNVLLADCSRQEVRMTCIVLHVVGACDDALCLIVGAAWSELFTTTFPLHP